MSAHLERGRFLLRLNRLRDAAAEFTRASGPGGDSQAPALALLALTSLDLGKVEEARTQVDCALAIAPDDHTVLLTALAVSGTLDRFEEARGFSSRLRSLHPESIAARSLSAQLEQHAQDYTACLAYCREGLALAPTDEDCLAYATSSLVCQGCHDEAETYARRLLALHPGSACGHIALCHIALHRLQFSQAVEHSLEALRLDPADPLAVLAHARATGMRNPLCRAVQRPLPTLVVVVLLCLPAVATAALLPHGAKTPDRLNMATSPVTLGLLWWTLYIGADDFYLGFRAVVDRSVRQAVDPDTWECFPFYALSLLGLLMAVIFNRWSFIGLSACGLLGAIPCLFLRKTAVTGRLVKSARFRVALIVLGIVLALGASVDMQIATTGLWALMAALIIGSVFALRSWKLSRHPAPQPL